MSLTDQQLGLTRLYLAAFNRTPEKSGLDYWSSRLDMGESLANVARTLLAGENAVTSPATNSYAGRDVFQPPSAANLPAPALNHDRTRGHAWEIGSAHLLGNVSGDTLVNINRVIGTAFDDFITDSKGAYDQTLIGGAGNDTLVMLTDQAEVTLPDNVEDLLGGELMQSTCADDNALLSLSSGASIALMGVAAATVSAEWFEQT